MVSEKFPRVTSLEKWGAGWCVAFPLIAFCLWAAMRISGPAGGLTIEGVAIDKAATIDKGILEESWKLLRTVSSVGLVASFLWLLSRGFRIGRKDERGNVYPFVSSRNRWPLFFLIWFAYSLLLIIAFVAMEWHFSRVPWWTDKVVYSDLFELLGVLSGAVPIMVLGYTRLLTMFRIAGLLDRSE